MKKTVLILAGALALTACGNSGTSSEDARIAEQQRQDSIANAEKAADLEALKQDSISEAMYANPITIEEGKAKYSETNPPSEGFNVSLPVSITNKTDVELTPSDYKITYCERVEYSDGSGHEDTPKSMLGPKLAPGETANLTINAKFVNGIAKVKAAMLMPIDEFKKLRSPSQSLAKTESQTKAQVSDNVFKGSWELEEPEEEFTYRYDVVLDLYAKSVNGASGKCYGCISYIFGFSSNSVENTFINEVKSIDGNTATVSMGSYDGNFEAIITYNPANKSITIKTPSKKDSGFDGKTFKKA